MMRQTLIYTLLIAVFAALFGCGTTGPLYIPEQRYPQEVESDTSQDETDVTPPEQTPNN